MNHTFNVNSSLCTVIAPRGSIKYQRSIPIINNMPLPDRYFTDNTYAWYDAKSSLFNWSTYLVSYQVLMDNMSDVFSALRTLIAALLCPLQNTFLAIYMIAAVQLTLCCNCDFIQTYCASYLLLY